MRKNPEKRLGSGQNDALDVKQQRFFKVTAEIFLQYNDVTRLSIKPKYVPVNF